MDAERLLQEREKDTDGHKASMEQLREESDVGVAALEVLLEVTA